MRKNWFMNVINVINHCQFAISCKTFISSNTHYIDKHDTVDQSDKVLSMIVLYKNQTILI